MCCRAHSTPDVECRLHRGVPPIDRCSGALMAVRRYCLEGAPWGGTIQFEPERFFDVDDERRARVRIG